MLRRRALKQWAVKEGWRWFIDGCKALRSDPIEGARSIGAGLGLAWQIDPMLVTNFENLDTSDWSSNQVVAFLEGVGNSRTAAMRLMGERGYGRPDFERLGWLLPASVLAEMFPDLPASE
jgi:hypothetical protein